MSRRKGPRKTDIEVKDWNNVCAEEALKPDKVYAVLWEHANTVQVHIAPDYPSVRHSGWLEDVVEAISGKFRIVLEALGGFVQAGGGHGAARGRGSPPGGPDSPERRAKVRGRLPNEHAADVKQERNNAGFSIQAPLFHAELQDF
jgi:hypothetical protein